MSPATASDNSRPAREDTRMGGYGFRTVPPSFSKSRYGLCCRAESGSGQTRERDTSRPLRPVTVGMRIGQTSPPPLRYSVSGSIRTASSRRPAVRGSAASESRQNRGGSSPAVPTASTAPTTPAKPASSSAPAASITSAGPAAPITPASPTSQAGPGAPAAPTGPAGPHPVPGRESESAPTDSAESGRQSPQCSRLRWIPRPVRQSPASASSNTVEITKTSSRLDI